MSTEERLCRLERSNRVLLRLFICTALTLMAALFMSAGKNGDTDPFADHAAFKKLDQFDGVVCRGLGVVNDKGEMVAFLGPSDDERGGILRLGLHKEAADFKRPASLVLVGGPDGSGLLMGFDGGNGSIMIGNPEKARFRYKLEVNDKSSGQYFIGLEKVVASLAARREGGAMVVSDMVAANTVITGTGMIKVDRPPSEGRPGSTD